MSVLGIDIGSAGCVIATIEKGSVKLVRNDLSEVITPSLVAYTEDERLFGGVAESRIKSNAKNTCRNMKNLIGRTMDDYIVQMEKNFSLGSLDTAEDGSVGYAVKYKGEDRVFSAATVMGTLLAGLKRLAEKSLNSSVRDVVIGVPGSYGDAQRRALINACRIAGLHCTRVLNEHTAVALDYGIYRQNTFDDVKPTNVVFVCGGQSLMIVSVVSFTKKGLKVLSDVIDVECVGRNFDIAIIKKFTDPFDKKHDTNLLSNPKARLKLEEVASKAKKTLSANKEAPFNIECVYEEYDISGMITREEFEEACAPYAATLESVIANAIKKSGVQVSDIHSVELVGGCTRIPWLQNVVSKAVPNVEVCRTLHMDECVARGCVLQAAMLSPNYKVKEFAVLDRYSDEVCIRWTKEDGTVKDAVVFPSGTEFGSLKVVTFERSTPLNLHLIIKKTKDDGSVVEEDLGAYHIDVPHAVGEKAKLKISVDLDIHGRMDIVSATAYEEKLTVEKVKVPVETAPAAPSAEGEAPAAETPAEPQMVEKEQSKTVIERKEVPINAPHRPALMTKEQLQMAYESEAAMHQSDVAFTEVNERLNELESLCYDSRDTAVKYATSDEREVIEKLVNETQSWLEDFGYELNRADIVAKLDALKAAMKDVKYRETEEIARKDNVPFIRAQLEKLRAYIDSDEQKYAHITAEKRQAASNSLKEVETYFYDIIAKQDVAPVTSAPLFNVASLIKKVEDVTKIVSKTMAEKAPKPVESAAPAPEGEAADTPMAEETNQEEVTAAPDMDLD
eukprot:GDKJ01023504.1.p1 GENE.GDKJ01023504.1~~GDKJ01023504.1.p1  ORF type:complete len:788 (-),score=262.10 GDKJ01023504.1:174-2537(-)